MAGGSPARRGFVHAFGRCHSSSIISTITPTLLASSIGQTCTVSTRTESLKHQESRKHPSVVASHYSTENSVDGHTYSKRGLPLDLDNFIISSPRPLKPASWANAIDSYLPLDLRSTHDTDTEESEESIQDEIWRPIHTLPEVLSMARVYCKEDLLSYIGVHQERWKAVIWLVKAVMERYPGHREMERKSCELPPIMWGSRDQNLNEITGHAIQLDVPQVSKVSRQHDRPPGFFSLDEYTGSRPSGHWDKTHNPGLRGLGQIWQSLGTMVLQAADHPAEDPSYSIIMSHVFQILGHLHRINAFPDSIYNYTPPKDLTVLQRPPTLHLLSKRIMSTLSDVEWELQWEVMITEARSQGYDLPKANVQPRLREFGPELWLDLILWACVEGGWIREGTWIVIEMQRRMLSKDTRWSTISWPKICEVKGPKLDWTSILKLEIDKTRLNQVGGIGMATGTNSHIEMGTRTISREVVLALFDGLLNNPRPTTGGPGMTVVELQRSILACKSLLDCNDSELDHHFMDAAILRIYESFENVKERPRSLNRILDLRSTDLKQETRSSGMKASAQDQAIDDPAAVLGLYHRILTHFSVDGNLEGSLQALRKIQSTIDTEREGKILAFADDLKERLARGDDVSDLIGDGEDHVALIQPPQIPTSALVPFLDLITNSRLFDLGNWLLLNEDIDGGLMDSALYSYQNLQPALLRFGTATSNSRLLTKVLSGLETPLSEPVVHALLRFQVALGKWTAVEELLEYLKRTSNMAWKPSDATSIAKAVLQMEHTSSNYANVDSIPRALSLVQNLVNGKYNSKADPSQLIPDFSQTRMANQVGRILRTLPGSLSKITTRPAGADLRTHASTDITPNAFNILLETMVDRYGSVAGKKLWDQWCREPNSPKREQRSHSYLEDGERVVTPTLYMLRNALRPVLETRRALHVAMKDVLKSPLGLKAAREFRLADEDQKILDWGISLYKKFGLSNNEINGEIPGSFPQKERRAKLVNDGVDVVFKEA